MNMKIRSLILALCLAGGLSFGLFQASAELEVSAGVSIHATADFYEPLGARGTWVEVGSYGRCWHPAGVVVGWRPYCDGYWEWTDCGWYWVSDEPWAWACYHYGTWVFDSGYGWVWVPGVEWAPAWVYWRVGGGCIGWAPCGPRGVIIAPSFYVFVESRNFNNPVRPGTVIVNNTTIINNTTEIRNVTRENRQFDGKSQKVVINNGPGVDMVEKATGQKFTAVSVREADRQTTASVPEKFKHQTAEPANPQKPSPVQQQPKEQPNSAPDHKLTPDGNQEVPAKKTVPPDRTVPQTPPGKMIPPSSKETPPSKEKQHPKEIIPPSQSPPPSTPVTPPGNPGSNEKSQGEDKDKDHGHDNS